MKRLQTLHLLLEKEREEWRSLGYAWKKTGSV